MRKIVLFAVAALVLTGVGVWIGVRALAPADALADYSTDKPPAVMTGAKGLPTSLYDDYEIVVH